MENCFKAVCPPENPQILLFDLGNILVRLNSVALLWPNKKPERGAPSFAERWSKSQAVYDFETGRIADLDAFYAAAKAELGFTIPENQFIPFFIKIIGDLFQETIPLLKALQRCYPLMLLSNTSPDHWFYCRDQLGLGGFFQEAFLSYQLGVMKPDPLIFEKVLNHLGCEPQNIWYFDDKAENAKIASDFGINAYTSWGGPPLVEQLAKLGLIESRKMQVTE